MGWREWRELVSGYKLSPLRWIRVGDLMCRLVTLGSDTVLCAWKWLRVDLKLSHHTPKKKRGSCDVVDVLYDCGKYFTVYMYIKSSWCMFKVYTVLSIIFKYNWGQGWNWSKGIKPQSQENEQDWASQPRKGRPLRTWNAKQRNLDMCLFIHSLFKWH